MRCPKDQSFNDRFPHGRVSWKFVKPYSYSCWRVGDGDIDPYPPHNSVEIPTETLEAIYSMGWKDAINAAREAIDENT